MKQTICMTHGKMSSMHRMHASFALDVYIYIYVSTYGWCNTHTHICIYIYIYYDISIVSYVRNIGCAKLDENSRREYIRPEFECPKHNAKHIYFKVVYLLMSRWRGKVPPEVGQPCHYTRAISQLSGSRQAGAKPSIVNDRKDNTQK